MKQFAACVALLSTLVIASQASAGVNLLEAQAHLDLGMATGLGDVRDTFGDGDGKGRFAAGFMSEAVFFLTPMFGLQAGLGFTGRGMRWDVDGDPKYKSTWFDIPLGVILDIEAFRLGFAFSFNFALSNKTKFEQGGIDFTVEDEWDNLRRANIAPKITAAYAIPVGPVNLLPGIAWSIHLIDEDDRDDLTARSMNIMVTLGASYGIPIGSGPYLQQ